MQKLLMIGEELAQDDEVARFVEHEGYRLLRATSRSDGLKLLKAEHPVVVMVDHLIGGEDGIDVLRDIREVAPSCEVILVTPGGEIDTAIEVLRAGALDYLRRPVDSNQLRIALGRARERRTLRKAPDPPAILVLEDHAPTRKRLLHVLSKEGYCVHGAADGEEGMRIFREVRFDLILSDVKMPNKSGIEVLRETKGAGADVEVIMSTGYGDEDLVVQALREGAIDFLKKPIDIEHLLVAVQKALDVQADRRSLAYRNRDVELMQEMVIRLTRKLELIVETPHTISEQAIEFFHQLVDTLPFGLVVIGSDREILFANRHVVGKVGTPIRLATGWLGQMGIPAITDDELDESFARMVKSAPGTIETLIVSKWAFLVMTTIKLVRPDSTDKFVALVIRGERTQNGRRGDAK